MNVKLVCVCVVTMLQKTKRTKFYTVNLPRYEQVCLMRLLLRSRPNGGRNITSNVALLTILAQDLISLLYYEHRQAKIFLRITQS